jgi:predicted ArsR family transcriptional regulator
MAAETQAEILHLLTELRSAGAAELAVRLGISPAGVRYHLAKLRAGGLIEDCPAPLDAEAASPGRPARCYRLPIYRAPDNLSGLCTALLHRMTGDGSPSGWQELAELMVVSPATHASMPQRLAFAVSQLNPLNYQAGWEAGPRGPRIRMNNCPYAAIWPAAPGLCRLDEAILSRLTAASARQAARTAFGASGPSSCLFEIRDRRP